MKRFLLFALLLSLFTVPSSAEDRRRDKSVLTIMTLNGEFLWDGVAPEEGSADFPWKGSRTEAEEHMRVVAEIIIRSDPDVINLVEVENIAAAARSMPRRRRRNGGTESNYQPRRLYERSGFKLIRSGRRPTRNRCAVRHGGR